VMGRALYDIKGLTYQGHLHQFWNADFTPDMKLFKKFREYLLENTQVNAVYYEITIKHKFINDQHKKMEDNTDYKDLYSISRD